jgi:hypothetical protein
MRCYRNVCKLIGAEGKIRVKDGGRTLRKGRVRNQRANGGQVEERVFAQIWLIYLSRKMAQSGRHRTEYSLYDVLAQGVGVELHKYQDSQEKEKTRAGAQRNGGMSRWQLSHLNRVLTVLIPQDFKYQYHASVSQIDSVSMLECIHGTPATLSPTACI